MSDNPIVIVGAGQAGLQLADSLRRGGYDGKLLLVGEESSLPYQRPPLSKQYLAGDMADERLLFRPQEFYAKKNIDVIVGAVVRDIKPSKKTVTIGEETIEYSQLALTTGAAVRRLPVAGADGDGVFYLRSLEDAQKIKERLSSGSCRVVAVGGGFIGLEIAAAARELGQAVTVVEAQERLMARVVAPQVSDYYLNLHTSHGVDVRLNAGVREIERTSDQDMSVVLDDDRRITTDIVVVGIGSIPRTELAEAAGLACDNGIVVNEYAQTSDPSIVAAGDCTMHRNVRNDASLRLESVQNAVDQSKIAAANLLGERKPYDQVPWFWSDQFEAKLQMVGTSAGHDRTVLRGSLEDHAFSNFYFRNEQLIGVDSVNRPADHIVSRKLIAAGVAVPESIVVDVAANLKSLL
jgi:3-phenylpropionate/trans-cinnamate dioxygenase ferredoxin reductase subunit